MSAERGPGERKFRFGAGVVAALALAVMGAAPSCGGGQQSLVVVALTATPPDARLTSVIIDVGSVSKTFMIKSGGLSDTAARFGVYVPSGTTGRVIVAATARREDGKSCGYQGTTHVMIASAGSVVTTPLDLTPATTCGNDAGAMGAAGSLGMGAAGSVGTGAAGTGAAGTGAAGTGAAGTGAAGTGAAGTGAAGTGAAGTGAAGTGTAGTGAAGTGAAGTGAAGSGAAGRDGGVDAPVDAPMDAPVEKPPTVVSPPSLTKCTEYSHVTGNCNINSGLNDASMWSVAFSPDGKLLLTAGDDGRVRVWTMTGAVPTPEGHVIDSEGQGYIAFSPDGKLLAVGSGSGALNVYDTATWVLKHALNGHTTRVEGVAWTSDSKQLLSVDTGAEMTLHVVGTSLDPLSTYTLADAGWSVAASPVISPTQLWVAVGYSNGDGVIANLRANPLAQTPITITSDFSGVYAVTFSPDGKTMAAGGDDGLAQFWAVPPPASGAALGMPISNMSSFGDIQGVNAIQYSPDGKHIAIAAGSLEPGRLGIWDAATHASRGSKVPTYFPISVAWSPSGSMVVAGEYDCGKFIICAD
jgi:hypothetical protein